MEASAEINVLVFKALQETSTDLIASLTRFNQRLKCAHWLIEESETEALYTLLFTL